MISGIGKKLYCDSFISKSQLFRSLFFNWESSTVKFVTKKSLFQEKNLLNLWQEILGKLTFRKPITMRFSYNLEKTKPNQKSREKIREKIIVIKKNPRSPSIQWNIYFISFKRHWCILCNVIIFTFNVSIACFW